MISDFQLALGGAAAVLVVGVIVYNRWQESKYKRRAERAFATDHPDVLIDDGGRSASAASKFDRVEPALNTAALGALSTTNSPNTVSPAFAHASAPAAAPSAAGKFAEDTMDDLGPITMPLPNVHASSALSSEHTHAPASVAAGKPVPVFAERAHPAPHLAPQVTTVPNAPALHAEIDSLALVLADAAIGPAQYLPVVEQSRHLGKGVQWEGLSGGLWKPIGADTHDNFRELRAGIQLADRQGPTEAMILNAFNDMIVQFSAQVKAVSQREEVEAALQRALEVDAFCADTDIEIAINVIGKNGGTFAVTKVRGLAESKGMLPVASGEYVQQDEHGHLLFTLRNMDPAEPPGIKRSTGYLSGLSLALDVPRTAHATKVFDQMFNVAIQFADVLQGEVVDDNRRLLTVNGRKVIADTVTEITQMMEARGVEPGGSTALRLYA
jgi:ZipA, C-terminal FtsZ-binding domain